MSTNVNELLPWHDGVKIVSRGSTVDQAIEDANLGRFVVRESQPGIRELYCEGQGSTAPAVFLKTLRRNIVPLQNNEAFALFQSLIDLGCLAIDSICEWKGSERIWMIFEVLNCRLLDDSEQFRPFLLFGHDPSRNYFKLSYFFTRASSKGVLTQGTFHNPEPKIPHDRMPRRFSVDNEKACEMMRTHLLSVINAFKQMSETPFSSEQVDRYFLDMAHYFPKPGETFRRTHLSDVQIGQFYLHCKEQLSRQTDLAGREATLWDAYNAVIEWVDREGSALHGWERLSELWFSGIKDSALYVALKRMKGTTN